MIPKRADDRSRLKYWVPFGLMRRWLARRYGIAVRNGSLAKTRITIADTTGFSAKDLLPLWLAMRLSRGDSGSIKVAEADRISELNRKISAERVAAAREKARLETEYLRLEVRYRALAAAVSGAEAVGAMDVEVSRHVQTCRFVDGGALYRRPESRPWNGWRLMDDHPVSVDMICSIGGDCIAASQQKIRGLRRYSLPFDWCFCDGEPAIRNFARQLESDFAGFAKKSNMKPIPGLTNAYKDIATGYNFMHHFQNPIETPGEYERFNEVFQRRVKRLLSEFERAKSVLFIVSKSWRIDVGCLEELSSAFGRRWPGKQCHIIAATYNSVPSAITRRGNVVVVRIARDRNTYDMTEKMFEWSFLDNVNLR